MGKARTTRYALRRDIRQRGSEWPLYRLSETGKVWLWATLRALHGGFRVVPKAAPPDWMLESQYRDGLFSGLPFFLQDVRPQGFLGRSIARRLQPEGRFPSDVSHWSDDDVVMYFLSEGEDLPGDFLLGDEALQKAQRLWDSLEATAIEQNQRRRRYPQLAQAVINGDAVGSSAGGEQPKFLATLQGKAGALRHVLVKFSPPVDSPAGRRWADLLVCEFLANETLRAHGQSASDCRLLDAGGRRFLEVDRFDRTAPLGRRGLVSLGALESAFAERTANNWAEAADNLLEAKLISETDASCLRWLWCFGELIANSDMHLANASFFFSDSGPWRLTPAYDMLPMQFRPTAQGEIASGISFSPRPPRASVLGVWPQAAKAAVEFWQRVASDSRVTPEFRKTAASCKRAVADLAARFAN